MRIFYLCPDLGIDPGGSKGGAAHLRGFLHALRSLDHDVLLLTPHATGSLQLSGGVPLPTVAVSRPGIIEGTSGTVEPRLHRALAHLWTNVRVEEALHAAIQRERPDLVYERYSPFSAAGAVTCRRLGVPHILEVNAPLAWEGTRYRRQALSRAAEALERAALEATDAIVTVSAELRDLLIEAGVEEAKVEVVPNGVDPEMFAPEGPIRRAGLEGKLVVGFVGSLKPWHGIEELVAAFLAAADPRFHLLVVGDGPERPRLEALAAERPGRVTRVGSVPHAEVAGYLRAMDIAVAPYPRLERFYYSPLKVLEYMAVGRAVVASDIGQVGELLEHDETGLLVPPGDVAALTRALTDLAGDLGRRARLGSAAAARVRERHLWTQRVERVLELGRVAA